MWGERQRTTCLLLGEPDRVDGGSFMSVRSTVASPASGFRLTEDITKPFSDGAIPKSGIYQIILLQFPKFHIDH